MKTKLEMAHEYAIALINSDCEMQFDKFIRLCWNYADAMQAEAEKRKPKEPRETHKNLAEFSMYPEYDASINYPPDAWVMYKGEKRLAASIDIKKEWQPDWSQAPSGYDYWVATADHDGKISGGWFYDVEPEFGESKGVSIYYSSNSNSTLTDSFGYTGDWRNSLRKRPK